MGRPGRDTHSGLVQRLLEQHTQEMDYQKELLEAIATLTDIEKSQLIYGLLRDDPTGLDYLDSRKWAWEQFKPTRDSLEAPRTP